MGRDYSRTIRVDSARVRWAVGSPHAASAVLLPFMCCRVVHILQWSGCRDLLFGSAARLSGSTAERQVFYVPASTLAGRVDL